jgi:hypothetical protein
VIFDFVTGIGVAVGIEKFLRLPLALIVQRRFEAMVESLLKTPNGLEDVLLLTDDDEQFDLDKFRSKT